MPNPWDNDPIAQPAVSPFGSRPVIQEHPAPKEPKPHYTPLPKTDPRYRPDYPSAQINDLTGEINFGPQSKSETDNPGQKITQDMSADHVIGQIGVARKQIDQGYDTGNLFGSKGFQAIPLIGQHSANLSATLDGLQGAVINDTIQQLKQLSSTGASGYGSLSETEATRLAGAVAALYQTQDAESLKRNLDELEKHYRSARAILAGEDPRDPAVAQKYGINLSAGAPGANGGNGGSGAPGGGPRKLNPQQQQEFFGILQSKGPEAANAYLQQFGLALKDPNAAAGAHSDSIDYGSLGHALAVGTGDVVQGFGDALGIVANPITQGINAVAGTNVRPDLGANLRDAFGLPKPQGNQEQFISSVNRGGTAALGFGGLAKAVAPIVEPLSGAVSNALARIGAAPLTDATAGASGGAASDLTRQAGGGPALQTVANFAGGAASLPASARVNALMQGSRELPAIVGAGKAEGVTVNRAMVDHGAQQKVTAVGKTMTGGRMMQRDMAQIGGQIENRTKALGNGGDVLEPAAAGQRIQSVAEKSIKQSGQQLGRRYDRLEKATEGLKVPPKEANAVIDNVLGKLKETPETNKEEIAFLEGMKSDFGKDLSVAALRRVRTTLRKKISKGDLTFGEDEANVLSIMDAASSDIANGLRAAGKGAAANEFKAVDQAYRDRMDFIKGTLQRVIGKRGANLSGEQVYANLKGMMSSRGDSGGLLRIMKTMEPEEKFDVAATIADALGKGQDGSFSTSNLVKHIEKIPHAARVAIWGEDGAKSLDNLQRLAAEHKRVAGALGGSPTGVANDYRSFLLNLLVGFGTGGATGSTMKGAAVAGGLMGAKMARDAVNARLLMSPKITGWLRSAPRTNNPEAINAHFDRLKAIAVREPGLAPQIRQLQEAILKTANDNAARTGAAAASPDEGPD